MEWLAVISITVLAVISPGPDFAMVTRCSLLYGRSAGVWVAWGIALGLTVTPLLQLMLAAYWPLLLLPRVSLRLRTSPV